jgi:hypothetical protein
MAVERPRFFVPFATDPAMAEEVWNATRAFVTNTLGPQITDHRIFRLGYVHDGKHMEAEVGEPHPYAKEIDWDAFEEVGDPEEVLVILEQDDGLFLVCTKSRGVARGEPIFVGAGEPYEVVYFEGYGPDRD